MLSAQTASTVSLTEDTSSNPPPHVQRCIEELRSLGISVSRHRLYKEVVKAHSPKLRKKRRIGLALDQYEEIMIYKAKLGGVSLSLELPSLLGESLHYLEDCLHVKGLFRKSPAVSRLRELEVSLASGKSLGELQPPPHDVASLVKSFLRSLPDPLFSEQIVSILTQCPSLLDKELRGILLACTLLSPASLHCLQAVLALLGMVADNSSENKMNRNSLAVVIAPTLFCSRHSLKKPLKERAITNNIIRVIETMLNNPEVLALVEMQATADDKWRERRRTGSLSDLLKLFPRKANKLRVSSQPYPVRARGISAENNPQFVSGVSANQPVIKSVRGKRPLEKYKPLLTEAKRARLLEQSGTMREVMIRRQIQIKDSKLVRRNAFLQRRGIWDLGSEPDVYINNEAAGVNKTTDNLRRDNSTPKIPYPFENIRKNLEFKFISEDSDPPTIFPISVNTQPQSPSSIADNDNNNNCASQNKQQEYSINSTESIIQVDTSGDMILSRSEESLENFADSLLNSNSDIRPHNFAKQTVTSPEISQLFNKSSYTLPRPSHARRVNRQCEYFQCSENRVHINDKDVILPSSIHEIYISANGCSSTPINVLDSPFRVMSSVRAATDDTDPLPTQFGTIPLQRNLRLKDRSNQETTPIPQSSPFSSVRHAQTEIPRRTRPPYLTTPVPAANSQSLTNSEISADTTGLTDSETPASFHRQHPIRKSFRKLLSPAVSSKRDKPDSDKDFFEKKEKSKSNSNPPSLKKNKPQRRWSLRGMFKSPTPPRPIIHTTIISSPIPIKLPFHPIFTQQGTGYKQTLPIVKRPCTKCTPPLDRANLSPTDVFSAEVTPECPEWVRSPPSIISSENSDMTSSSEYKLNTHSKEDPLSDLLLPMPLMPPQRDATHNTVTTPSDLTSEDILRDDSFSDTSFDTSPLMLDEESPVTLYPFVEASIFAKPHMGAIKVLPDLPPLAPLKRTKALYKPATLPRRNKSFREDCLIEEIDSETEEGACIPADVAKRSCENISDVCVETNPLPDVADCVKLFEAMGRPNSEARRDPNVRASFGGFYLEKNHNHPRLIKRASMREPDGL